MSSYLYQYAEAEIPQANSAFVGVLARGVKVYLLPNIDDGSATLVGQWDNDGTLVFIDQTVYTELRPLGNEEINLYDGDGNITGTKTGIATDHLDIVHYQGHIQKKVQASAVENTLAEYPSDNQPFKLKITRTQILDDGFPHIPWRWTIVMLSNDPLRDIIVRAIGVYNENGTYLGTTGSFVLMDFEELDDEDEPVIVQRYGCECPAVFWKAEPETIYFKLLYSGQPEGEWQLIDLDEGATQTRLFWNGDQ